MNGQPQVSNAGFHKDRNRLGKGRENVQSLLLMNSMDLSPRSRVDPRPEKKALDCGK